MKNVHKHLIPMKKFKFWPFPSRKYKPDKTKFSEFTIINDEIPAGQRVRIYDIDSYNNVYRCNEVERAIPNFNPNYAITLNDEQIV